MQEISFEPVKDRDALATRWRAMETVAQGGFFRGWTYLGALLPHFAAPHLLEVRRDGQDLALALFNRRRGRFALHEVGDPAWDRITVEHNGLLLVPGAEGAVAASLAVALRRGPLVLSGIDDFTRAAAAQIGVLQLRASRLAPAVTQGAAHAPRDAYLASLSANARAQIRRALRLYGPDLMIEQAGTAAQALAFFYRLVTLHQASWSARGKPGAFGDPEIVEFHRRLIRAGLPRGEIMLLRVSAGEREVGLLYNLRQGGRVLSYQSGFVAESDARLKPGLVCHTLAVAKAWANAEGTYDFLAGDQRYKTTLAPRGGQMLHWGVLRRPGSLGARAAGVLDALRAVRTSSR